MQFQRKRSHRGFTMIELLLVIGIIAILASIVIVAINPTKQLSSARDAKRKHEANQLEKALNQYLIDKGVFPVTIPEGSSGVKPICREGQSDTSCLDFDLLTPDYLVSIPQDASETNAFFSGYKAYGQSGRPQVTSTYVGGVVIGTQASPGGSCLLIKNGGGSTGNGTYWIDPDGTGGAAPMQAYCDMTTDGGGWTLVVNTGTFANCAWTKDPCGDAYPWNPWLETYGTYSAGTNTKFSIPIYQFSGNSSGNDLEVMMKMDGAYYAGYAGSDLACAFYHPGTADCTNVSNWRYKNAETDAYTACATQSHAQSQWWGWTWTFNNHAGQGNCSYESYGTLLHDPEVIYHGSKGHWGFGGFTRFEIFVRKL